MHVIMAAAGRGSRFKSHSKVPKPFLLINHRPMWRLAADPWIKAGSIVHVLFNRDHEEYFDSSFVDAKVDIGWIESYTRGMAETAAIATQMFSLKPSNLLF